MVKRKIIAAVDDSAVTNITLWSPSMVSKRHSGDGWPREYLSEPRLGIHPLSTGNLTFTTAAHVLFSINPVFMKSSIMEHTCCLVPLICSRNWAQNMLILSSYRPANMSL